MAGKSDHSDASALEKIRSLARFPDENPNPVLRVRYDGEVLYANAPSAATRWRC